MSINGKGCWKKSCEVERHHTDCYAFHCVESSSFFFGKGGSSQCWVKHSLAEMAMSSRHGCHDQWEGRIDPKENKWTRVASMSTRRLGVAVAVLGGFLYAVGGSDGTSPLNTGQSLPKSVQFPQSSTFSLGESPYKKSKKSRLSYNLLGKLFSLQESVTLSSSSAPSATIIFWYFPQMFLSPSAL